MRITWWEKKKPQKAKETKKTEEEEAILYIQVGCIKSREKYLHMEKWGTQDVFDHISSYLSSQI